MVQWDLKDRGIWDGKTCKGHLCFHPCLWGALPIPGKQMSVSL